MFHLEKFSLLKEPLSFNNQREKSLKDILNQQINTELLGISGANEVTYPFQAEEYSYYRSLFDNNSAAVLLVDPQAKIIVNANQAAWNYYGYTQNHLKNLKINTLLNTEELLDKTQEHRNYFLSANRLANGEIREVEVYRSLITIDGKELLYLIIHDRADKNQVEPKILQQNIEEKLQQNNENLTMLQIVHAMSTLLEIRDPYTYTHQNRVADLTVAIAIEMRQSKEQLNLIYLAAIVHDIGKFRIPTEILCKPGKIDAIEYNLIKTHSQSGFEILKKLDFPKTVTQIVLQHHERLDGSGYPQGLLADEILLEAKIIGVADVVEAMASHRPYRPSLGLENAMAEIAQHRETLYDPSVVDACIKVIRESGFDFNRISKQ